MTASDLTVRAGSTTLLDGVCLSVEPGQVLALLGPNGAGKSTLLAALSGEGRPARGVVHLDGRPLSQLDRGVLARRRAVMLQEDPLSFGFPVGAVVMVGRQPHLLGTRESPRDREIVARAMRLCGVTHLAGRIYPTLSGGERQRVRLARALAQIWEPQPEGPCTLLLDEPTSALDLVHQHQVLSMLRSLAGAGLAVLVVLHDLSLAARYADRVALLSAGRLLAAGPPAQVLEPDLIERAFQVRASVVPHPVLGTPLVTPLGAPPRAPAPAWRTP